MRLGPAVLLAALPLALAAGVSLADDPDPSGRALPAGLKQMIWAKGCDLLDQNFDVDCATNVDSTKCRFVRSSGEKFEPGTGDYTRSFNLARSVGTYGAFEPALREAKLLGDEQYEDFAAYLFKVASGLQLSVAPPDDYIVHLNPIAVQWIARELLPPVDAPMCGVTAGEVYTTVYQRMLRSSALAYEHLKKGGHLKKVDRARLERERGTRQGGYWRLCESLDRGPLKVGLPERALLDECQFWLRRGATSAVGELGDLLGVVLERFDPTFYRVHARTFGPGPGARGPAPRPGSE